MTEYLDKLLPYISTKLINNLIYTNDQGYVLYNKYEIIKVKDHYEVDRNTDGSKFLFSKLRNAATWAILDRYNKIFEAKRVLELDSILSSINVEVQIHKRLQKIGTLESREINRDKYLIDVAKQKQFQWELDKYIIMAKTCQSKGYQNELNGTSRK